MERPEPSGGGSKGAGFDADQDDENDPKWYRNYASSYPCYKLTEQALFNFEMMRNTDSDWEVTDSQGRRVSFNFCTYAASTSSGCAKEAFAFVRSGSHCEELTSNEPVAEVNTYIDRSSSTKPGETQDGIRIERGGGAVCDADPTQLYSITIDVWCNPDVKDTPSQVRSASHGPLDDDEADPCDVYISMEHANGCVVLNLQPYLAALGTFMIISGVCLQWMGPKAQQKFMVFIVRLGTFLIICSFAYEKNYFAFADPSEPPQKKDPVKFFLALVVALVA